MRYLKDALWMKSSLQVPPPSLHAVAAVGGGGRSFLVCWTAWPGSVGPPQSQSCILCERPREGQVLRPFPVVPPVLWCDDAGRLVCVSER